MNRFTLTLVISIIFVIQIFAVSYIFNECGWKAVFLGNGAAYAAMSGMCEKEFKKDTYN